MVQELIAYDVLVLNGKTQQHAFFIMRPGATRPHFFD
ncbi:hypothetical protein XGA_3322 [Xanthomonas hortorum ATCC 19865]|nr:hypothetical protein XGA_3322 [Xanthomonas hortorum ATCC 19865]